MRAVNHPQVQFLYDMFHEQMSGQLIEKLEKHIDVIGLIHMADVPGRHEPGTGEINYANIYRKLVELNYRHNVAMEFRPVLATRSHAAGGERNGRAHGAGLSALTARGFLWALACERRRPEQLHLIYC